MIVDKIQKRIIMSIKQDVERTIDIATLKMRSTLRSCPDLRVGDTLKIDIRILVEHYDDRESLQKTLQDSR